MPDSQVPPLWGPAYDERDLDALLSGETGSAPPALQPVAGTLAALRAAATRRELSDEAVARAAFRAFALVVPATGPQTAAPATGPRPGARHRHRRPAARSARKPRIAVTGVAAAALVAVAVVAGALTGSIGQLTSFGRAPASASASARSTGQSPGSQGTLVTGAATERPQKPKLKPKPTASATPTTPSPTSSPGALCHEYFQDAGHPVQGDDPAWIALEGQLSKLAGGSSPVKIYGYCLRFDNPVNARGGEPAGAPTGGPATAGPADTGSGGVGGGNQGNQPSGTSDQPKSVDPASAASRS